MKRLGLVWLLLGAVSCQGSQDATPSDAFDEIVEPAPEDTPEDTNPEQEVEPSDASDEEPPVDPWARVRDAISISNIDALSFTVGTADGVVFTHHKGNSTVTTRYLSASSIKWVTSAVILRLVEEGLLGLDNHPQDYLDWWTSDPEDYRSTVTIRHLLSFTAGLSGTPFGDNTPDCVSDGETTLAACAQEIYEREFINPPGEAYFYGPSSMQILGGIAEAVSGQSWLEVYTSRVAEPVGMTDTVYHWPSVQNPRMSGGAGTTMQDFQRFAHAMLTNAYWPTTWDEMVLDHTPSPEVRVVYSPMTGSSRGWHYGLGVWLECMNPDWEESCNSVGVISASGAWGFHLWVDVVRGHYAVLAMEDQASGWQTSIQLSFMLREYVASAVAARRGA